MQCANNKYLVTGPDGVADNQLSASSYYNISMWFCTDGMEPKNARLNNTGTCGAWSAFDNNDPDDFVQVDFLAVRLTTGVVVTGRAHTAVQYVDRFKLLYSLDCVTFTYVVDEHGTEKVFQGGISEDDVVTSCFKSPLPARCIRINPTPWQGWKSLRFDILGY